MSAMKIDLRTIQLWVTKWEKGIGVNRTASQLAAVMLNKILERTEERAARVATLLKEIASESEALQELEKTLLCSSGRGEAVDSSTQRELHSHRRRMAAILKESDRLLRSPEPAQSVTVGGILLEISRQSPPAEHTA
jgi:hypothetical protein